MADEASRAGVAGEPGGSAPLGSPPSCAALFGSLRGRLIATFSCATLALLLSSGAAIYVGVEQALQRSLDASLDGMAATEIASAFDGPRVHVHQYPHESRLLTSDEERYVCITDAEGRVLAQTSNLREHPTFAEQARRAAYLGPTRAGFATVSQGGQRWRCIAHPTHAPDGRPMVEYVAVSCRPLEQSLASVRGVIGGVTLAGALLAGLVAYVAGSRLTRPLVRLAEAADAMRAGTRTEALPQTSRDAEVISLTTALNHLLAGLQGALASVKAAMEAQRRFVGDAAHELRSPLTNLTCALEVTLRRPRSPEAYRETLESSLAEVRRLSRLSEDLLTMSRVDAGQLNLVKGSCRLDEVARGVAVAAEARALELGVRVALDCSPTVVWGDADRLHQVASNLLDNALQHAPRGSAVQLVTRPDAGRGVLWVEDAGPGIPEGARAAVFERFFRLDPARARPEGRRSSSAADRGGAGLGLSIAHALVVAHSGTLHVEEGASGGARLVACLPSAAVGPSAEGPALE